MGPRGRVVGAALTARKGWQDGVVSISFSARNPGSSRGRLIRLGVAGAGAALVLSGCGVDRFAHAGSSAEVEVTHTELQESFRELQPLQEPMRQAGLPLLPDLEPADLLTLMLVGPEVEEAWAAAEAAAELPPQAQQWDATALLVEAQQVAQVEDPTTTFSPELLQTVDTFYYLFVLTDPAALPAQPEDLTVELLTSSVLGSQDLAPADVDVNPRYGQWDTAASAIVQTDPEWIQEETRAPEQNPAPNPAPLN